MTSVDDVRWDLEPLLGGRDVDALLDAADALVPQVEACRGRVASLDAGELAAVHATMAEIRDLVERADSYAGLSYAADTTDPSTGALVAKVDERSTAISTRLVFFGLEWAEVPDEQVEAVLADERMTPYRHHLRSVRRYRPHLLSEPEERIDTEKDQTGRAAFTRLYDQLVSDIRCRVGDADVPLEQAFGGMYAADRSARQATAAAITDGLAPGLRTRTFVYNTLMLDRSVDDRLRSYPWWASSRNLSNEASDASVRALVEAVTARNDLARRWYRAKARLLGLERLADYDRMAAVTAVDREVGWDDATAVVIDAYQSFSPELAAIVRRFVTEPWIDAPVRPGKRPGAFCAYTVPSHHPYLLLNWTSRQSDVLTLAHELGHGVHAYLSRPQGVFHMGTPLTLAETASVFGETVTFGRLLDATTDPSARLALLAHQVEGAIATVFRQVAMFRFEDLAHTARRTDGELSADALGDLWARTQTDLLGDAVEVTEGYRSWWSYIPHFIHTPGYVYAYAYGQLLALSVYRRYTDEGPAFVPRYLELLSAGGSMPPEELGRIVGCDLADPDFWDGGLDIVAEQVAAAESAAASATPAAAATPS